MLPYRNNDFLKASRIQEPFPSEKTKSRVVQLEMNERVGREIGRKVGGISTGEGQTGLLGAGEMRYDKAVDRFRLHCSLTSN